MYANVNPREAMCSSFVKRCVVLLKSLNLDMCCDFAGVRHATQHSVPRDVGEERHKRQQLTATCFTLIYITNSDS